MTQTQAISHPTSKETIRTGLKELMDTVMHHNITYGSARAPLIGVERSWQNDVILYCGEREERFSVTVHKNDAELVGRGGAFDLSDRADRQNALNTVLPFSETTRSYLHLRERLSERGFTLNEGDSSRWKNDIHLIPLTATHPDGTVLWFQIHDADWTSCRSVGHGLTWLGSYSSNLDEELEMIMQMEDEELKESGFEHLVKERINPQIYGVSGEAIEAIIAHARLKPNELMLPQDVPHRVPSDFFARAQHGEFDTPEHGYTREKALAQGRAFRAEQARRKAEAASQTGVETKDEGLPF